MNPGIGKVKTIGEHSIRFSAAARKDPGLYCCIRRMSCSPEEVGYI